MITRLRREARMYQVLLAAAMRAQGQYRANLIIELIGAIAYQGAGFAFVWVVVDRFGQIGGWGLPELALLYGLRLGAHGVFTSLFAQLMGPISEVVREGEFDRYLTRPVDPLLQLITRRFNLTVIGDLIGGIVLIVAGASRVDVAWTTPAVAYLLLAIVGGALVEASLPPRRQRAVVPHDHHPGGLRRHRPAAVHARRLSAEDLPDRLPARTDLPVPARVHRLLPRRGAARPR